MLSLKPKLIARYADIARLLVKYGRSDLAEAGGLPATLADRGESVETEPDSDVGPESLVNDLEQRGPVYVKLGQLLSTRADLLPQPYLQALTRLQDDVERVPLEEIQQIISEDLGVRISRGFQEFDEQPLAAASLAQVHRAVLRDGRDVVVKVQRPDIRHRVADDLEALVELGEFLEEHTQFAKDTGLLDIVNTLNATILDELDYRREAENARLLHENLAEFDCFRVPEVIEGLGSSRVLTMEYVSGVKITDVSPTVLLELDRIGLAEQLFQAYLKQILVDGCFHSDPHPGNLLLTSDHRIALMDFGMVTRVGPRMQQRLLKLLLAISDGLGEEAATLAIAIGRPRERFDEPTFVADIANLVTENHHRNVERLEAGRIVMEIQAVAGRCGLRLPRELTMLGKTLLNLDQVVSTLHPEFDPNAAVRDRASKIMEQQTYDRLSLTRAYNALLEATEFAQELPARANKFAQTLANNELHIRVDAIDEKRLMAGLQKIANRIATGLVLAALILGASTLMKSDSTFLFVVATIFFVLAGAAGLILVGRAVFVDESHPSTS